MMRRWLLFIIVFLTGLVIFFPSFKLSLYGDDWLVFWRYSYFYPVEYTPSIWDHISHFLTRYGSQDVLISFLKSIFGYQSSYYYITSFLFRMTAAFSLYPITFYLTKSKLAAFFAMLFFSITTIGLETTEYLAHIPSYISLTFFNLFLYFFIVSREGQKNRQLLYSGLFFFLTFIFAPIRMTGLLPFIFLIDIFWLLQNLNRKIFKKFAIRLSFILLVFLFINISGNPFLFPTQQTNESSQSNIFLFNQTRDSLFHLIELLKEGRTDLLFYPIISFGGMFIPDTALPTSQGTKLIILALIGGLTTLLGFYLLLKFYRNNFASTAIFTSLSWSMLAFFMPWFWNPTFLLDTYHRYLIGSAVGISLFLAIIISLIKNARYQRLVLFLLLIILSLHIWVSSSHISKLLNNHNQQVSDKIWSTMPYIREVGQNKEPLVFYFEGDGTNESILHDTVTFGFPFHMGLLYKITDENKNPISMIEWKDVESAVLDGKSFAPHTKGRVLDPISPERVYAFRLQGKDNLINITDIARQKLSELIQSKQ